MNAKLDGYVAKCMNALQTNLGKYAKSIVETTGFKQMDLSSMKLFLQSDDISIKEKDIWQNVLKWQQYHLWRRNNDAKYEFLYSFSLIVY